MSKWRSHVSCSSTVIGSTSCSSVKELLSLVAIYVRSKRIGMVFKWQKLVSLIIINKFQSMCGQKV